MNNEEIEREPTPDSVASGRHSKLSKEFYIELAAFSDSIYDRGKVFCYLATWLLSVTGYYSISMGGVNKPETLRLFEENLQVVQKKLYEIIRASQVFM